MENEFDFDEIKAKADELAEACKFKDIGVSDGFLWVILLLLLATCDSNIFKDKAFYNNEFMEDIEDAE